ncbi:BatA domain-containing protein, partial [Arthrospira platensis SPKY1]|nr:BatA domain-containing protein [Arthrospira platensis SPKY1]
MDNIAFLHPQFFWLLGLLPVLIGWYVWTRNRSRASIIVSNQSAFGKPGSVNQWVHLPFVLRIIALMLLIL